MQGPPAIRSGSAAPSLFTELDEANIVHALVEAVGRFASAPVELQLDVSCEANVFVPGAPHDWESALGDLLQNAVDDSPAGAAVEVRLYPIEDGLRLSVSDAGPGVRPDEFAEYYQRPALDGVRRALQIGGGKIAISSGGARPGARVDVTIHAADVREDDRFLA